MSYSNHRPGRFGSEGRIEFDVDAEDTDSQPLYLEDVIAAQNGGRRDEDDLFDDQETRPIDTADLRTEPVASPRPEPVPPRPEAAPPRPEPVEGHDSEPDLDALFESARPTPMTEPAPEPEPEASPLYAAMTGAAEPSRRATKPRKRGGGWRRLAILGGAEGTILDEVPSETPRFVQMFFVLAGTALVSAISMFFALITGVGVLAWIAVPLALVWALIIFNLDRFLTSTMKSTHNIWRLIGLAIPRVILAALIGIVVAEPLVLQVFHNDIAREVNSTNIVNAQADQKGITGGPEKKALDAASQRLSALQSQAQTGVVAGTSTTSAAAAAAQSTVDGLTTKLAQQQKVIDQARALYQCELTGKGKGTVPGCTGVTGDGASAQAAKQQLASAQTSYDALAAKLRDANTTLSQADAAGTASVAANAATAKKEAKDQLPAAQKTYDAALAAYNDRAAAVAGGNSAATGLLSQITGLDRLSQQEPTLLWAHGLIAALFFMIELLPVIVKVLTSYGDPSLYERAEALRKQVALDRVTARSWNDRADIARTNGAG
ncbi:hypothetical protein LK09_00315 [Microbacterium mangrovi]|uniref:DUF4407 domain-containing protein n=1 Tax=Microbacterium mangrovi TaxID=1348253 RepID=A0A0B2ADR7_9MICO|nr:DUF4407 domain-containing protein [Microbacterium mangrovi]KHK99825.1 hypothetical protein LK09_00315 [Microbacterium mangrovi]